MKPNFFCTTVFAACLSVCTPVLADDTGLYADVLPDDASFVRFIGFDGLDNADFAGVRFDLMADEADKYIPISTTRLKDVAPGSYVSVLRAADGTQTIIAEGGRSRQPKVALILVNGSDAPLELRLADGSVAVIKDVAPATSDLRDVNPVAIALGVFVPGKLDPLATFDVALRRGQNLSFVADAQGVRLIENQFAPLAK